MPDIIKLRECDLSTIDMRTLGPEDRTEDRTLSPKPLVSLMPHGSTMRVAVGARPVNGP